MNPARLGSRCLYLCTPDRPDLEDFIGKCVTGGVDIVQLRDKHLEAKALLARAEVVVQLCRSLGVPFILNDRPDLALEVGADGVHLGQDDAPPALARKILGEQAIIGLSTHRTSDLVAAIDEPVDYISAGPVEATPTKPGRLGTGGQYVAEAARISGRPFYVTGGVTPKSIPELSQLGATRFVVVRYLTESDDPEAGARLLRTAIAQSSRTQDFKSSRAQEPRA